MSGKKKLCEDTKIIKDDIQLNITTKNGDYNIVLEGEEYTVVIIDEKYKVFKRVEEREEKSFFEMIKSKEEEKLEIQLQIKKQEYEKKHCNHDHARPEAIPCPLPRAVVVKLFNSVGLTPPSPNSSICSPSEIM